MKQMQTRIAFCLMPIAIGLAACSDSSISVPLPLGDIEIIADEACDDARCVQFVVTHDAFDEPASGRVTIDEPDGAIAGTIIVFSGGGGTWTWGEPRAMPAVIPPGVDVAAVRARFDGQQDSIAAWLEAGFRVARIKWDRNWFQGSDVDEGFARLAAKPATITDWIADEVAVESGPMCVGGGSGGAGQTSYMLTHYGMEDRIDLAVPWSGFWMGQIDTGCLNENPLTSLLQFNDSARAAIDLSYGFGDGEVGPCQRRDDAFEQEFFDASIANSGDYHYPNTLVHHILGGADEVGALGQGMTYYEAMLKGGSPHVFIDVLPGVGHGIEMTEIGRTKIRNAFLLECRNF